MSVKDYDRKHSPHLVGVNNNKVSCPAMFLNIKVKKSENSQLLK